MDRKDLQNRLKYRLVINGIDINPTVTLSAQKLKKLEHLIRVSDRVKIEDMVSVIGFSRAILLDMLLDLEAKYHFRIQDEVIAFKAGSDPMNFIKDLERDFAKWGLNNKK